MSDLIKREDAINAVEMFFKDAYIEDSDVHCADMVYEINHISTASPWHRVEDGLPKIGKIVLVYDDWDRLSICQLDNQYRWLRQGGGWFDVPYVRYWMPIEQPKEEYNA